jgi:hypothetical protein
VRKQFFLSQSTEKNQLAALDKRLPGALEGLSATGTEEGLKTTLVFVIPRQCSAFSMKSPGHKIVSKIRAGGNASRTSCQ